MDEIFLSVRNLKTLLLKLNRVMVGESSACTVIKSDNAHPRLAQTMPTIAVTGVEGEDDSFSEEEPRLYLSRVTMARLLWLLQEVDAGRAAQAAVTIGPLTVNAVRDTEYYADRPAGRILLVDNPDHTRIPQRHEMH